MGLSDERREQLAKAMHAAFAAGFKAPNFWELTTLREEWHRAAETAYNHLRPIILAEALEQTTNENLDEELRRLMDAWDWDSETLRGAVVTSRVRQMIRDGVCIWALNRLTALTAPPVDKAVEAVTRHLNNLPYSKEAFAVIAAEIVAAVRKADSEAK